MTQLRIYITTHTEDIILTVVSFVGSRCKCTLRFIDLCILRSEFPSHPFLSSKFLICSFIHSLHKYMYGRDYANSGVMCRSMKLKVQMYSQTHQALCVRFGISELSIILSPFEATQEDHQSQFQFYSLSLLIAPFQAFPSSSNLALSPHKVPVQQVPI